MGRARVKGRCSWRVLPALVVIALATSLLPAGACQCYWVGPFLKVAPACSLIVRAQVIDYAEIGKDGAPLAMDVEIREVLRGHRPRSPMRIWGDNGWLCRPYVTQFPRGTEWLFALNGPGSKPAMSPGPSLSICGTYWLQIVAGAAVGNIADTTSQAAVQGWPLAAVRANLEGETGPGSFAAEARDSIAFEGEVRGGDSFARGFGPRLVFQLEPEPHGWRIMVREEERAEDLSRLTPPLHFVPNPREIAGWHFRNADNTGPNEAGEQNVNAPGEVRDFVFSPEVGRTIAGPQAAASITPEDVESVARFGRGTLTILDYRLNNLRPDTQAGMEWMRFRVVLSWPAGTPGEREQP